MRYKRQKMTLPKVSFEHSIRIKRAFYLIEFPTKTRDIKLEKGPFH